MLMIRLQRTGKRGQAYFRVVILEHTSRVKGKYLELLGTYNPHQKEFKVKKDRIEHWVSKGAQVSPTVNNLLVNYKVWDKPKMQSWKPKKKAQVEGGNTSTVPASAGEARSAVAESSSEAKPEAQPTPATQ